MEIRVGDRFQGFVVTRCRQLQEISMDLIEMTHERTGAGLCWIRNELKNRMFCMSFRTPPEDDTGVFHILEHTLLNGSERFPVHEPFVELLKSSMSTFLNAMTGSDWTMYPVSSCNEQDFLNLAEVYLDAAFAPAIRHNPNMFRQEGWHVELTEPEGAPSFQGVVYNEMKGALSSMEEAGSVWMGRMLYPDTCYRFVSGGDPARMPELTYEKYRETYYRFYHPSNCYFWLDGDIPLEKTLALIERALSPFSGPGPRHETAWQQPAPAREEWHPYAVEPGEEEAGKAQLVMGKLFGTWKTPQDNIAVNLIGNALTGSNDAPLMRALLERGLAQDVSMSMNLGLQQNNFELWIQNIDDSRSEEIRSVVRDTARSLVRDGINRDDLEAALNRNIFRLKEPHEPSGMMRMLLASHSFHFGGDPALYLQLDDVFRKLRENLKTRYYEELLEQLLLKEDDLSVLHLVPSRTLAEEMRHQEQERLDSMAAGWTAADRERICRECLEMKQWQQTPDTPEQLASLPRLSLSEVSREVRKSTTVEEKWGDTVVLRHTASSNGIIYTNLYFRITGLTGPQLSVLRVFSKLLGQLPTERRSVQELLRETRRKTGKMKFSVILMGSEERRDVVCPYLMAACSALPEHQDDAMRLLSEILLETDFSAAPQAKEIVLQIEDVERRMVATNGDSFALDRAQAHFSTSAAAGEYTGGIEYVRWLHTLAQSFEEEYAAIVPLLEQIQRDYLCKANLLLSFTSNRPEQIDPAPVLAMYPQGESCAKWMSCSLSSTPLKEGISVPAQISFAAMAYEPPELMERNGTAALLSNILSLDYLWNEVRVRSGAYGVQGSVGTRGEISASSFRDPDPGSTLASFRGMARFSQEYAESGADLTGYIISTISQSDAPLGPDSISELEDSDYLTGRTDEKRQKRRLELLEAKPDSLQRWIRPLERFAQEAAVCVIGPPDALAALAEEGLQISKL